jgi:1,4-alpha-glucan branching enzyme
MALKKQFVKSKQLFKVTFSIPEEAVGDAKKVSLAGDFNEWDINADPMKKQKDGSFLINIYLEPGRAYQFRYLIDNTKWENDWEADSYIPHAFGDGDNSLLIL